MTDVCLRSMHTVRTNYRLKFVCMSLIAGLLTRTRIVVEGAKMH